ncbi:MAG: hypothetical protein K2L00_00015, partial [Muribaculaceae bacterium]|nr:hypothetical protein [Muribaculaceae bacterium]
MKTLNAITMSMSLIATAATLSACSSSEEPRNADESPQNAIRFAANTEFSRAGDITTSNLTTFN